MKYKNDQGEPISGFYEFNQEMIEINKKRSKTCMNPACDGIIYLKDGERPEIYLGRTCLICHSKEYLKDSTEL